MNLFRCNAQIINGKGKWLIPGLIDMHVHNLADINFSANYPTKGALFMRIRRILCYCI